MVAGPQHIGCSRLPYVPKYAKPLFSSMTAVGRPSSPVVRFNASTLVKFDSLILTMDAGPNGLVPKYANPLAVSITAEVRPASERFNVRKPASVKEERLTLTTTPGADVTPK